MVQRPTIIRTRPSIINPRLKTKISADQVKIEHQTEISKEIPRRKSNRVFIVGGGASLKGFDFNRLKDEDTIVINKAIEHVPNAHIFITMDYTFIDTPHKLLNCDFGIIKKNSEYSVFVLNTLGGKILTVNGVYTDTRFNYKYSQLHKFDYVIESKNILDIRHGFGIDVPSFKHGNNSGYCALQLALLMGYEEIYLLGFDLNAEGVSTHFHDGYKNQPNFSANLKQYRASFIRSLKSTKDNNKIFSCSEKSALNDVIEYKNIDAILEQKSFLSKVAETVFPKKEDPVVQPTSGKLDDLMVVGYYTINTPYEQEARKTIKSCKKFNLNHHITGVPNFGDWQANTRYKAKFMLDMLDKFPDKRLLYVDCDAAFLRYPKLFEDYHCDIAVRWQDFRWRKNECLSGTIYMENNSKIRKLCKMWMQNNDIEGNNPKTFEQWNLGKAITDMEKSDALVTMNLPPEYTFIFDIMKRIYPNAKPVIEHYQASRKFKHKL